MRFSEKLRIIMSGILSVSLTGCAAMFNGSSQVMSIRSNIDDAKLYVDESYIGKGNGVATFQKKKSYTIRARKEGCRDGILVPSKSFDPTTLLGILIDWGIISILIVDGAATGAWQKFDQTGFTIDPDCSPKPDDAVPEVKEEVVAPVVQGNGGSINKK